MAHSAPPPQEKADLEKGIFCETEFLGIQIFREKKHANNKNLKKQKNCKVW